MKRFTSCLSLVLLSWVFISPARVEINPVFAQSQLRVPEPPEISQGAQANIEIEKSPEAFKALSAQPGEPSPGAQPSVEPNDPLAPPLLGSIEGIDFDGDATQSQFFHIPPDPAGAVGTNHVVKVSNTSIRWYTKAGVLQNSQRLGRNATTAVGSFFASLSPQTNMFDPKVIFDQHSNRFLVVALERVGTVNNQASNRSRIFVAVSDDSDPNGTWSFLDIDAKIVITTADRWADFPGFAVDEEAVYITANMFSFASSPGFGGVRLWIINKTPFYSGGAANFSVFDPVTLAIPDPVLGPPIATTMQPSQMYGLAPGSVGSFLMSYGGINDTTSTFLQMIRVDSPLGAPVFTTKFISWGTIAANDNISMPLPGAAQMGTANTVATNDRRVSQNPVWRANNLYLAAPVLPPSGPDLNQTTAHWWRVNTTVLSSPVIADQGNVGGENIGVGTHTFFPTVTADANGNMAIGFAASGPNIFPGAYYTGRKSSDPPGTVQPVGALRTGLASYFRTFGCPTPATNRWGDYSGIWLDPSNQTTFWVFNEYALTQGTTGLGTCASSQAENGRWGTACGRFTFGLPLNGTFTIGVFRVPGNIFYLRNTNTTGSPDVSVSFGAPGDVPIVGDWDGDGTTTIGLYRPSISTFYLRNSNTSGFPDITVSFGDGPGGDLPIAGDWDGDGVWTIGVYRPGTSTFYLRNSNTVGFPDLSIPFGAAGDLPVVGDWDGDGTTTIGLFRPTGPIFYLRNSNTAGFPDLSIAYGAAGDLPIVGDWDGNGTVTIGIYRPTGSIFYLRNSNSTGFPDLSVPFGAAGDKPLAGNWDGM